MKRKGASTLTWSAAAKSSAVVRSIGAMRKTPALLTRMRGVPCADRIVAIARSTAARSATSQATMDAFDPIAFAAASSAGTPRATSTTCAPPRASIVAVARPIPRDAPVTTAT